MIRATAIIVALALSACAARPVVPDTLPRAVYLPCSALCTASCLPDTWPQWTGDPDSPQTSRTWPEQVAEPLQRIAKACDVARGACVACLRNGEAAGLFCGAVGECR